MCLTKFNDYILVFGEPYNLAVVGSTTKTIIQNKNVLWSSFIFSFALAKNNTCSLITTDIIVGAYKVYQNEHNSPRIPNLLLIISFRCNCSIPPLNEGMYTCLINFQPLSRPCVFHLTFIGVPLSSECYLYSTASKILGQQPLTVLSWTV